MFFYMISLMCTVVPCAHVIHTEGPLYVAVSSEVIPVGYSSAQFVLPPPVSPANRSLFEQHPTSSDHKTGRAYLPSSRDEFHVNQINVPVQDQPTQYVESSSVLDDPNPVVAIKDGQLRGFIMKTISSRPFAAFQGVPFAQAPVDSLRFQAPRRNFPWSGVRDAIESSPECIQADYIQQYKVHGQEDCLYLNVYTPKIPKPNHKRKLLPVMVFIHGGGFFFGSSSIYGPAFILDQDIVLVSMNYRLGALGFLSTGDAVSPGNNGLKDQVLALRWVQENIAAFGGDPNSVTLFGESAGASAVKFHYFSALSRGLFHRGISQSGSAATCFWSIDEHAPETAKRFGSLLNCTGNSAEMIACLRTKDATQLASTHLYFLEWLMYPVVVFGPVVEPKHTGAFLTEQPDELYKQNKVAKVPWISGYNSDEGAINIAVLFLDNKTIPQLNNEWEKYGPVFLETRNASNSEETLRKIRSYYLGNKEISFENRKPAIDMFGDRYSISCGLKAMRYHSIYTGQPVYAYHLSYNGKYSIVQLLGQNSHDWGVSHLDDLIYQFNNTAYYPEIKLEDKEYKFSQIMNNMWANFASHGKPYLSTDGRFRDIWEPIDRSTSLDSPLKFLDLNLEPKMIDDPFAERDRFWRGLDLKD